MTIVSVPLGERSYSIVIGRPLEELGGHLLKIPQFKRNPPKKALIVSHPFLYRKYGGHLLKSLSRAGIESSFCPVPEGESSKNLLAVRDVYRHCIRQKLDRTSVIAALGGGVIGDLAGFAAATYLRGIAVVQIPTTLLAMVDSAIGGKTGVDLPESKNSVGAFHQPALVWADTQTLKTLPQKEMRNGFAEIIKYGVIADPKLFDELESRASLIISGKYRQIPQIIERCAAIKSRVVAKDERETKGMREILNFGHTLGHAVETVTGYKTYKHGEAISIGMCAAGFIARIMNLWSEAEKNRMEDLIARAGLPLRLLKPLPEKKVTAALLRDKKIKSGTLRYVLPVKIGRVVVRPIPFGLAMEGLRYVRR